MTQDSQNGNVNDSLRGHLKISAAQQAEQEGPFPFPPQTSIDPFALSLLVVVGHLIIHHGKA